SPAPPFPAPDTSSPASPQMARWPSPAVASSCATPPSLSRPPAKMAGATKRLRVGLIGASPRGGWGAQSHLPALQALPDIELAAICTAHEETAREASQKFGVPLAYHHHQD